MAQVTESDYREAQLGDERIRQEFLDTLHLEDVKKFVNKVVYFPDNEENTLMCCGKDYFDFPEKFGIAIPKSTKSTLIVYPTSFNLPLSLFLSALIDHEGQHARQNYMKPIFRAQLYAKELSTRNEKKLLYYELLDEIPAYANEAARSDLRKINPKCLTHVVLHSIDKIGRLRRRFSPIRDAEEDLRAGLCDSPGDDLVRKLLETQKIQIAIQGRGLK
jgi:hypothetical protein